jgi:hypothetical protein
LAVSGYFLLAISVTLSAKDYHKNQAAYSLKAHCMKRIEIYSSPKEAFVGTLGAAGFVFIGILMLAHPSIFLEPFESGAILIRALGLVGVLFFGYVLFSIQKQVSKTELALAIDEHGIYANPKQSPSDYIAWKDIVGISEVGVKRQRLVVIQVSNPEEWIQKEPSAIRKNLLKLSVSICGSPFSFSANTLETSHSQLMRVLRDSLAQYKASL